MASEEDTFWQTGKCSGTMYCGDMRPLRLPQRGVRACSHVRTPCSATCAPAPRASRARSSRWPSTCMHAERSRRISRRETPCGNRSPRAAPRASSPRWSPTASKGRDERGISGRRSSCRRPRTRPSTRAAHLFGVEMRRAPVDPETTLVDVDFVADRSTPAPSRSSARPGTTATARSIRSRELSAAGARSRRRPARRRLPRRLHPALGEELGYDDPGRSISGSRA